MTCPCVRPHTRAVYPVVRSGFLTQQIYTLLRKANEQLAGTRSSQAIHACHAPGGSWEAVAGTPVTVSLLLERPFAMLSVVYRKTCGSPGRSLGLSVAYLGSWQS